MVRSYSVVLPSLCLHVEALLGLLGCYRGHGPLLQLGRSYSWDAPTVKQRLQLSRIHSWDAPDGALQYGQFGAGHAANSLHSALG